MNNQTPYAELLIPKVNPRCTLKDGQRHQFAWHNGQALHVLIGPTLTVLVTLELQPHNARVCN